MGIHYLSSELFFLLFTLLCAAFPAIFEKVSDHILSINILGAFLPIPICYYFFLQDQKKRHISHFIFGKALPIPEFIFLLFLGMALALYGNILISMLPFDQELLSYSSNVRSIWGDSSYFFILLWCVICAPISEELIFRWLIFLRLRDYHGVPAATLLSAFLFGIFHGNLIQFLYSFCLGILLALIIQRTENLWSCILIHAGANLLSILLSLAGDFFYYTKYGNILLQFSSVFLLAIIAAAFFRYVIKKKA